MGGRPAWTSRRGHREAERSLSITLALAHHQSAEAGDRAATELQHLEERHRQQRLDAMKGLACDLEKMIDELEADPGSAWIEQGRKEKVRMLARQVRNDLAALADLRPATTAAPEPGQLAAAEE